MSADREVVEHAAKIGLGSTAVALDEAQRIAAAQIITDRDDPAPGVDREQRADHVVGAVGTDER